MSCFSIADHQQEKSCSIIRSVCLHVQKLPPGRAVPAQNGGSKMKNKPEILVPQAEIGIAEVIVALHCASQLPHVALGATTAVWTTLQ